MDRRSWTLQEDLAIRDLVHQFGILDWTVISQKLKEKYNIKERTGKQCRERWYNHLNPQVNKKPWNADEENLLFQIHRKSGNKWKLISKYFEGRTDNDIKNHFYSTLRRSLRRLNKFIGQKNSTTQMREIKPSVLSTIMNYIYQQQNSIENKIVNELKNLPYLIFQFSNDKPVKSKLKRNEDEDIKKKIGFIFSLVNNANLAYQMIKVASKNSKKKNLSNIQDNDLIQKQLRLSLQQTDQIDFIKYFLKKIYLPLSQPNFTNKKSQKYTQKWSQQNFKEKSLHKHQINFKKSGESQIKPEKLRKKNQTNLPFADFIQQNVEHHPEFIIKRIDEIDYHPFNNQKECNEQEEEEEIRPLRERRISLEAHEDFMQDDSIVDIDQPSFFSGFQELVVVGKQIPIYSGEQLQRVNQIPQPSSQENIDELIEINYSN